MTMAIPGQPGTIAEIDQQEWDAANTGAAEVMGFSLYGGKENDNTLDALVGVPFSVLTITFREGDIKVDKEDERARDYVSLEILVHPAYAHKFNRKYVVFNDGSTGIYRQIVKFLAARGDISLDESLPESGDAHTTRYDVSFSDGPDEPAVFVGKLKAPEGLRKSEYDGPTGKAVTWYLA